MTARDEILSFLRTPTDLAIDAGDAAVWLTGLDDVALPAIAKAQDYELREAQIHAWRGLSERRVGLVLGPPGTGKTYLLSWMIVGYAVARLEAGLSCRVFVTAFTRNAVGNLLTAVSERLSHHFPQRLRPIYLGTPPPEGVDQKIEHIESRDSADVIAALRSGAVVLGGTIWSLNRLLEAGGLAGSDGPTAQEFDLICVDEASQLVVGQGLMALAGLNAGGRIVVAGDDRQLPPIRMARNIDVEGRALGGSLYSFLKSTKVAEFALEETFRLNAPLTVFPERNFYPERYASAVPGARLTLRANWRDGLADWQQVALDPAMPVVVIVHDGPVSATSNHFEAGLVASLTCALRERMVGKLGMPVEEQVFWEKALAIVSPHRAHNALIRKRLLETEGDAARVETIDRIQGREREAIFLSYSVADAEFAVAEAQFIFSPERLNVATTRARTKLVMIISRRLLEAVPAQQEFIDNAEVLREFVFTCEHRGDFTSESSTGATVGIHLRGRGFEGEQWEDVEPGPSADRSAGVVMTGEMDRVLEAIRRIAVASPYNSARLDEIRTALARPSNPFAECRDLHGLGHVSLQERKGKYGRFWIAIPLAATRRVHGIDIESVRQRIAQAIRDTRQGRLAPFYSKVRDRFCWMTDEGNDALLTVLQRLQDEGFVRFDQTTNGDLTIDIVRQMAAVSVEDDPPREPILLDEDFVILNALEDIEVKKINFGVFGSWSSVAGIVKRVGRGADAVVASLGRLSAGGYLMLAEDGRIRSRMAEIAREVRYAKQRFQSDDAGRRPYVVRSLKVEVSDRRKPGRTVPLRSLAVQLDEHLALAHEGIVRALEGLWGDEARIANFQARGYEAVLAAWHGQSADTMLVAAETGAGKTEAVLLPMIVAATADALRGVIGVRAVLTYPRVRLAANQAQRIARYLSIVGEAQSLPQLTVGLQVGQVPQRFSSLVDRERQAGWEELGSGEFGFPLFECPVCSGRLHLKANAGLGGADELRCTNGDWQFGGWIGSKEGLARNPPTFFLPTVDSLHQWLHDPRYGALFGDDPRFASPRALVADEVHLYTHIHGAQVGLALRRLLHRARTNDLAGRRMVAVGMSATLGDPATAWGRLVGRSPVAVITPEVTETEPNAKGREYFYFVQPEIESRGQDIAGASTTIQSLMCIAHSMRRRTGKDGGYRGLVFLDSIDKLRRLHSAYDDAEARGLAALRTRDYGDDPNGTPRRQCCQNPIGCDRFSDGECWWFAANDADQRGVAGRLQPGDQLAVVKTPIFSGTEGSAERLIKSADIVLATSSLEVGYDDPDMALVYQHYAPQSLSSFIQRKGRGGRGADDRPVTGVTLSLYSPRDTWWFGHRREMLAPSGFESPLNPDNHFVRRGQAACALLDGMVRYSANGANVFTTAGSLTDDATRFVDDYVKKIFGEEVWLEFDVDGCAAFWRIAAKDVIGTPELRSLRNRLQWAPQFLSDTINLPSVVIDIGEDRVAESRHEDIALVLHAVAPGNASRRFHPTFVHWRTPVSGLAPWLIEVDYEVAVWTTLADSSETLLAELPEETRRTLDGIETRLCRPTRISLERLGRLIGSSWTGDWTCNRLNTTVQRIVGGRPPAIKHESKSHLRGFVVVRTQTEAGACIEHTVIEPWFSRIEQFVGDDSRKRSSGLHLVRAYWGSDAEIAIDERNAESIGISQVFVAPGQTRPLLHGYEVETEGLRLTLNSNHLDTFISSEVERLQTDRNEATWLRCKHLRFLIESRTQNLGVNVFEARRAAELIVIAEGDAELKGRLKRLLRFWDGGELDALLQSVRGRWRENDPLMTARRVTRVATSVATDEFRAALKQSLEDVDRPPAFAGYLRTLVLHGVMLRLRELFIHVGRGDERRVVAHVQLPIQFGNLTDDVITIAEAGAHGDGTTRTVAKRMNEVFALWHEGFLSACPNAVEDEIRATFWTMTDRHNLWRALDLRETANVEKLAQELGLGTDIDGVPTSLLQLLSGSEEIDGEEFQVYDLAREIELCRQELEARLGRWIVPAELASAVVRHAQAEAGSSLGRLHRAYGRLPDSAGGESLSAGARLSEQVLRIGGRLCLDGCRACVHQFSDLMSDSLVEASVSRNILSRFLRSN